MSKRFTETTKWNDPWFRRLTPSQKCLWLLICDVCDAAGVIDLDLEMASFQIGDSVSDADLEAIKTRLEKLPSGKWRIVKFLGFQYGELSAACPAHKPVFKALQGHGIKANESLLDRVSNTLQEKDKDKEKDTDGKEGAGGKPSGDWPERIVSAYVRRDAPMECMEAVKQDILGGEPPEEILQSVREVASLCRAAPSGSDNAFVPKAKSFFLERQWRSPEAFRERWKPKETKPPPIGSRPTNGTQPSRPF